MTKSLLQLSTIISPFPQITFKYTNISIPKSFSIVVDDHMSDVNQLVAYIFTKISHYRNVSILYLTQNLFDKNKYARTINLNAQYLVFFKNCRDAGQFAIFARQMYPTCWKFAVEGYKDATSVPCGYLLVDLNPDQDERYRLRTNVFPGRCSTCIFTSKCIDMLGRQWMAIYVNNNIHYGEWLRYRPIRLFECYLWQMDL